MSLFHVTKGTIRHILNKIYLWIIVHGSHFPLNMQYSYTYGLHNQLRALVVSVLPKSWRLDSSIPDRVIPKTVKMGPDASLLGTLDRLGVRPCDRLASYPGGVLVHQAASHYRNRRYAPAPMSRCGSHKLRLMQSSPLTSAYSLNSIESRNSFTAH
jgi:hypothetical protein